MWIEVLGAALLHSTWQFTLIGLALYLSLQILSARASQVRYLAGCAALAACLAAFLSTMLWAAPRTAVSAMPESSAALAQGGFDFVSMIVIAWLLGAAVIFTYNSLSLLRISKYKSSSRQSIPAEITASFHALCQKIGLPRDASLRLSDTLRVPCTFGTLKPIVLLPAELITRLSADEIEAILAHELAHIRRYDYLVNIVQQAIFSVLYYHPAVHFISREIDREREIACDDLATHVTGHPRDLARALGKVTLFAHAPSLAMAALGCENDVASRMSRLVNPAQQTVRNGLKMITTAMAAAGVLLFANLTLAYASGNAVELTEAQGAELRNEICKQVKRDGYYYRSDFAKTGMVRVDLRNDAVMLNGEFVPEGKLPGYNKIIDKYGLQRGDGHYIYFNSRGDEIELGQAKSQGKKQDKETDKNKDSARPNS